ncbi:MotE family protein [Bradyrhizobium daqingense]|uniref:Flagellar motility protein MotE (MotC chaperone) n=1 Tax=Bradyrhizobium daqingense TaxID=993502 RepID=A0A562LA55_9BRAD|nr:MotE family protein [Bradyrhizobium daqingense]TWI04446.1 flagellar motility protein MotE (MotC chaperone) [Bradyrhizobium daqingense]UFS91632.1 MotE family protein [Bradyrhizobium daqingense]
MLKLDHQAKLLLVAVWTLAGASPVLALDEAKASKPLNLLSFARARASGSQKLASPIPGADAIRATAWAAEDSGPAITGAVPAAETPAPVRAAKPGSVTAPPKPAAPQATVPADNEVALFCSNVADPAVDARLAWQLKELEKAESLLRERIAEVETKRAEYEKWMALRDEFLKKAEASVVEIYSRMKPEAAATQIAGMSDETAAAVLAKLSPRSSSAIFNEMDTARAAHLADLLGGMRRVDDGKTR